MIRSFVEPLIAQGADAIVLGCTHYALLTPVIETIVGPEIEIIDPAEAVARQVSRVLEERNLLGEGTTEDISYVTTGDADNFDQQLEWLASRLPVQR